MGFRLSLTLKPWLSVRPFRRKLNRGISLTPGPLRGDHRGFYSLVLTPLSVLGFRSLPRFGTSSSGTLPPEKKQKEKTPLRTPRPSLSSQCLGSFVLDGTRNPPERTDPFPTPRPDPSGG